MIYDSLFILAQATMSQSATPASSGGSGAGGLGSFLIPMLALVALMYFMTIRPQSQKQKQQQALIAAIKTGDKVVTSGGMHGLVANVKETTVIVKVADNVKIEIDKSAITLVSKRTEADSATPAAS
jgi:preprotein translocase subunit YajC